MFRWLGKRPATAWAIGLTMGLLIGVGAFFGALAALSPQASTSSEFVFPEIPLHATASHGESSITLATGDVDGEAEALYILDHVTGDLQCWVVNTRPRAAGPPGLSGTFATNVLHDLEVEGDKTPKFVMVTGHYQYSGGGGTSRPASSIVYVADANSGNVVGYSFMWNSSMVARGTAQRSALNKVVAGKGRNAAIRPGGDIGVGQP